jgi:quinoprotein glucose dehydrogenase
MIVVGASIGGFFATERLERPTAPVAPTSVAARDVSGDWPDYGNTPAGTRFSPIAQINTANVDELRRAWVFDAGQRPGQMRGTLEATPLKIGDTLYICTGYNDVIALDAETGRQRWRHDSAVDAYAVTVGTCRGVAYYRVPGATGLCAERIYTATVDARLIAMDRLTGESCPNFGEGGVTSLLTGMGSVTKGYYYVTSAPQIVRGKLIVGGWVTDGQYVGEPPGVVRAYDAVTGSFAWAWDPGRPMVHVQPAAGDHYTLGTPNSWAPMSADEKLGVLFVPTGNATPDYFGAQRSREMDQYSSSVVALDADTGEVRWSFQTTHHDLWDYDVGSQPTLVDIPFGNITVPVAIQATKRGEIFMLDRRDGAPIFPVSERPVPQQPVEGERLSPTQPFSSLPSFRGEDPAERTMWGLTPLDQLWCRIRFRQARFDGTLTPPGLNPFLSVPGYIGGMDWGSVSLDPDRHLMIFPSSKLANYVQLITRASADERRLKPTTGGGGLDIGVAPQMGTPYAALIAPFISPLDIPCERPPFGMLNAIDYRTGKVVWRRPLGVARDLGPLGIGFHLPFTIGTPTTGGALVTRGGLTFIGASQDRTLRAFETQSGRLLWRAVDLPASALATPMTYISPASGRQFVVVAAGGNYRLGQKISNSIVAYALPATPAR